MSIIDDFNDWADESIAMWRSIPGTHQAKIDTLEFAKSNLKSLATCKLTKDVCLDKDACNSCPISVRLYMEGK